MITIQVIAAFGRGNTHPHLRGAVAGMWPCQVIDEADAELVGNLPADDLTGKQVRDERGVDETAGCGERQPAVWFIVLSRSW